jgi:hypothetical protein
MFDRWKHSGGHFTWDVAQPEKGRFLFGDFSIGGEIHPGYDEQGYTSDWRAPRLQINYRMSDGQADVDLDGYAPWILGFIPNPFHMTYANSDVRQWYDSYVKKLGDPGFSVEKMKFGN